MRRNYEEGTRERIGATLFLGIDETEPGDDLDRFLEDLRPGGIILFRRNIVSAEQVARLNGSLLGNGAHPRLVGVDQEGGRVERLREVLGPLPTAAALAEGGEPAVRRFAELLGRSLASLGFNLNFAPVLDLSSPGEPNGIGDRAFGRDPGLVGPLGRAYLEGLETGGVLGVAKHFPGLGPTGVDTHQALARADKTEEAFRGEDLAPFRDALGRAPAVMVGHAHYPFWDDEPRPASGSPAVIGGLLREELGYEGLAIADDLEMGAVDQGEGWLDAGVQAIRAGCDMLLICRSRARMRAFRDHLAAAVRQGRLPAARVEEAARRVEGARRQAAALRRTRPGRGSIEALIDGFGVTPPAGDAR